MGWRFCKKTVLLSGATREEYWRIVSGGGVADNCTVSSKKHCTLIVLSKRTKRQKRFLPFCFLFDILGLQIQTPFYFITRLLSSDTARSINSSAVIEPRSPFSPRSLTESVPFSTSLSPIISI